MTILFPVWFITHCISRLTHLPVIRWTAGTRYYYFTMVVNIIGLILGIFMICNPFLSFLSVSYIIGVYLLILGTDHIVVAVSKVGMR